MRKLGFLSMLLLGVLNSCTEEKKPCTETVTFPGTTSTIEKPCD